VATPGSRTAQLAFGVSRVSPTTASAAVNAATMSVSGTETKFEVMNWNR
jgi:hypothetical protein